MGRCCAPVWSVAGDVSEDELSRLIAWVLNELEPAPGETSWGMSMAEAPRRPPRYER